MRRILSGSEQTPVEKTPGETGSPPDSMSGRQKKPLSAYLASQPKTNAKPDTINADGSQTPPPQPPQGGGNWLQRFSSAPRSCLTWSLIALILTSILFIFSLLSFLAYQYYTIATNLPPVDDLQARASQFETTRLYDRNGNLIYEIIDPNAGRRTYVRLDEISPYLVAATLATEDKDFYNNPGFDLFGILRAMVQNYTAGGTVSGASTVTQQLARILLLSSEERYERTVQRKAREIVLAAEITRKYSKDEILELYLNEIFYGNLAYGIEAAAETYFNTTADQLDLAQASFLAGLPQAPAVHDIFSNRDGTLLRHKDVLNLMYQLSEEENCIEVSNSDVPVCVTLNDAVAAAQYIEGYTFNPRTFNLPFPHWINYIRVLLEEKYDAQTIYRSGFRVYTTLDPDLQNYAQQSVRQQVEALAEKKATDGALVAIRPQTGEILAMVGSADFFNDAIAGQVNMTLAPRQPGSSIKPLTYTAAFEKGWTPSTLIWDVASEFPPSGEESDTRDPYKPVNYDGKFHGPVLVRTALGSSYNVPAVKTLDFVGIYDDPETSQKDGFINFASKMGITTLTRNDYGLSLTLGGGDVTLLEMTGAYAIYANNGNRIPPHAITRIEDHFGNLVYEYETPAASQVISAEHAYLITDILADNDARKPAFGANSVLRLPFKAAVKTGTTNDYRDNWTLGYTPDIAIGVWVGNADYSNMENISGVAGAAPIWSDVMQWAIQRYNGGQPSVFPQPAGITEAVVCAVSGTLPSEECPSQKREIFASSQPPLDKKEDLWKKVEIDGWTGLLANSSCDNYEVEKVTLNVKDKWAIKWLTEKDAGKEWAKSMGFDEPILFTPEKECSGDEGSLKLMFVGLMDNMTISQSPLDISILVSAPANYQQLVLSYGIGDSPSQWDIMLDSKSQYPEATKVYSLDLTNINASRITLQLAVQSTTGIWVNHYVRLNIMVPTLTPTLTPTPTEIPTETPTPTPIIEVPTLTPTPTETPIPLESPTPFQPSTPTP